jgi:hypothetical protein
MGDDLIQFYDVTMEFGEVWNFDLISWLIFDMARAIIVRASNISHPTSAQSKASQMQFITPSTPP